MLGNSKRYLGIVIAAVSLGGVNQTIEAEAQFSQGQIYALESALYGAGYDIKKVDGVLDSATKKAIKKFQQDDPKLMATGKVNTKILASLGIDTTQSFDNVATATQVVDVKAEMIPEVAAVAAKKVAPVVNSVTTVATPAQPMAKVETVDVPAMAAPLGKQQMTKPQAKIVASAKPVTAVVAEKAPVEPEKKSGWFW